MGVGEDVRSGCGALVAVLNVVESGLVRLPDFDPGSGDRSAIGASNGSLDPTGLA